MSWQPDFFGGRQMKEKETKRWWWRWSYDDNDVDDEVDPDIFWSILHEECNAVSMLEARTAYNIGCHHDNYDIGNDYDYDDINDDFTDDKESVSQLVGGLTTTYFQSFCLKACIPILLGQKCCS